MISTRRGFLAGLGAAAFAAPAIVHAGNLMPVKVMQPLIDTVEWNTYPIMLHPWQLADLQRALNVLRAKQLQGVTILKMIPSEGVLFINGGSDAH